MAGTNWQKYLMDTEGSGIGGVDQSALGRGAYGEQQPEIDFIEAMRLKRMGDPIYSEFTPTPKARIIPGSGENEGDPTQGTLFNPYPGIAQQQAAQQRQQTNSGIDAAMAGGKQLFSKFAPPVSSRVDPTLSNSRPVDWNRNAGNTGFNPTYDQANPMFGAFGGVREPRQPVTATTPPFVSPQQAAGRAPRPQMPRPPARNLLPSPAEATAPTAAPSYTPQAPIDFAGQLSGAAQRGGGSYGDFGASQMLGPEERAAAAARAQQAANAPKMPQYDYGPMTRYQEYLKSEPDRDQLKPGKWGRILNAASAGASAWEGGIDRGIKTGEYLNERPYQDAFKKWQSKGTRVAADATMAETRYKNQVEAYNKNEDNKRADAALKLTERGVDINQAKLFLDIKKEENNGWQSITGPDGMMYRQKVVDGRMQTLPTGMPATEYTAAQKMAEVAGLEAGRNYRHVTPSGSAVLGANTSMFNNANTINAQGQRQLAQFDFTGEQNDKDRNIRTSEGRAQREVTTRGQDKTFEAATTPRVVAPTSSNTSTPGGLMQYKYPEFNNDGVVQIREGKPALNPKFRGSDDGGLNNAEIVKYIGTITRDPAKGRELFERFKSMHGDLGSFATR